MSKMIINEEFLNYAVIGAAVLGTGGGGNPKIGYLMAKQAIKKYGPIDLIDVSELRDDQISGSVSMMGAPSVTGEKIPNGNEFVQLIKAIEKEKGKKMEAIYPIEAGGLNSMIPIVAAATLRLPLLDCDCMGRAFPELQMITQTIFDIPNTPIALCHEKLDTVLVNAKNPKDMENYCRYLTMSFGGSAMMAECLVTKKEIELFAVRNIVSLSYKIGKIIKHSENIIDDLINECGAFHLFDGKITDMLRTYEGGFNKGKVTINSFDNKEMYEIFLQNENLIALKNGKAIAMVPDLIQLLDYQTKMPITTENLKFGQRVSAIAFKCDEKWRSEKGLSIVSPRNFGYDYDYIELEKLVGEK